MLINLSFLYFSLKYSSCPSWLKRIIKSFSKHCVSLSRSCLTICKYCTIKTIKDFVRTFWHKWIQIFLSWLIWKNLVIPTDNIISHIINLNSFTILHFINNNFFSYLSHHQRSNSNCYFKFFFCFFIWIVLLCFI